MNCTMWFTGRSHKNDAVLAWREQFVAGNQRRGVVVCPVFRKRVLPHRTARRRVNADDFAAVPNQDDSPFVRHRGWDKSANVIALPDTIGRRDVTRSR